MRHGVAICALALFAVVATERAFAQIIVRHTWVASFGNDSSSFCDRIAPCRTFAGALPKTSYGGEIRCVDAANYERVVIATAVTIACADSQGGIEFTSNAAIRITAGPDDDVVLRGLFLHKLTEYSSNGVEFISGRSLRIENSVIQDGNPGYGILFNPSSGMPELYVSNSVIASNGDGTTGGGIQIQPTGSAGARVVIDGSQIVNNVVGIRADANGTTGRIDMMVSGSVVSGSSYHGIVALAAAGPVFASVAGTKVANNGVEGLRAVGANARIRVGDSWVTGNGTGVAVANGGKVQSYGDNRINNNTVDGFVPTIIDSK